MNTTTITIRLLGAVLMAFALAGNTAAQGLAPLDRGTYTDTGFHPGAYGYITGNCTNCTGTAKRSWFVFDLGCVPDTITSAALSIEMPIDGYQSVHASETFELFDVTTAPLVLMSGVGGVPAFDDLGSGTSLGSVTVSATDEGLAIQIPFDASGLAYLNANLGGLVAIGGAVTSLDADPATKELLFAPSTDWAVRLITTPSCNVRDAFDRGWYLDDGFHDPGHLAYPAGNDGGTGREYRNFFAIPSSGLGGLVTGATLALENPYGLSSQDATETYQLFEVSTPVAAVLDGTGGVAAFDDLADGPVHGAVNLAVADGKAAVKIPLSANGLVALNEAGSTFLLGGALTTLDGDPTTTEGAFGSSAPYHGITQMLFDVEPQWSWLGGGTEGGLGQPLLLGAGPLTAGSQATIELTNAPPNALALAWLSFGPTMPYAALGGTVHAWPFNNQFLFPVDASGALSVSTIWPAGVPSGTPVWFQFIVQDGSSIHGITLSNGLLATTP